MKLSMWNFEFIQLDLRVTWKIARNSSTFKKNLIVTYKDTECSFKGEAAPNIRYGETPKSLEEDVESFKRLINECADFDTLYKRTIKANLSNCFKFAVTSIYHQREAALQNLSMFEYLKLAPVDQCQTSFSLPMLELEEIYHYLEQNKLFNSPLLKLKVRNDQDIPQYQELRKHFSGKVIIDANEGMQSQKEWNSFIEKLRDFSNIALIEQPFPADQIELYKTIKPDSPVPLFLDESITQQPITAELQDLCHGVNIKLMKSADILIAKKQLEEAKELGFQTMLGCMIESSLSISMAFYLSGITDYIDLDGFALLKEDPSQVMSYKQQILKLDLSDNNR